MTVQLTPQQVLRIQRAATEDFTFRLVKVNGEAVVRVGSPSGNEYTVRGNGSCDCRDAEFNPELKCKHSCGAALWLQRDPLAEMAREEQETRRAAVRARRAVDFPD